MTPDSPTLDFVVRSLKIEEPHLMLVRTILVAVAIRLQSNAPAWRDHLATHLAAGGSSQSHIGKIGLLN